MENANTKKERRFKLKDTLKSLCDAALCYPAAVILLQAAAVLGYLNLRSPLFAYVGVGCTAIGCALGAVFAVMAEMLCKQRGPGARKALCFAMPVLVSAAFSVIFWLNRGSVYEPTIILGSIAVVLLLFFAVCCSADPNAFQKVMESGILSLIAAAVCFIGMAVVLSAFRELVLDSDFFQNLYILLACECFIFLAPTLFLWRFGADSGKDSGKSSVYSFVIRNIALPVYFLLVAVLLIYFIKNLLGGGIPGGSVNLYASLALAFYVFFALQCGISDRGLFPIFKRFGGFVMLPILLMQLAAVGIRLAAYGFTPARWYSACCILGGVLFLAESFRKNPHYGRIFIACAVIAALCCFTPLNGLDVANYSQSRRLEKLLAKNDMYSDGEISPAPADIISEDAVQIIEAATYLRSSKGRKSELALRMETAGDLEAFFGLKLPANNTYDTVWYRYHTEDDRMDVSGYSYASPEYFSISVGDDDLLFRALLCEMEPYIKYTMEHGGEEQELIPFKVTVGEECYAARCVSVSVNGAGEAVSISFEGLLLQN